MWPSAKNSDAAAAVAGILAKTLATLLLPGALGTLVGESAGALIDSAAGRNREGRKLRRDISAIAENIAEHSIAAVEYSGVAPHDLEAAIVAVGDTLQAVSVDNQLIREAGFSAERLYEYYREQDGERLTRAALGTAEQAYLQILREVSRRIIGVLLLSPEAHGAALHDVFAQLRRLTEQLDFPSELRRSLDQADDWDYRVTYRDKAGLRLARIPVNRPPGLCRVPMAATYVEPAVRVDDTVRPVTEALAGRRRVFIAGPPGAGKTWLLRRLFLEALRPESAARAPGWAGLVPLYLDVDGRADLPPLDQVPELLNPSMARSPNGWAGNLSRQGQAVVMVDGLESVLGQPLDGPDNLDALEQVVAEAGTETVVILAGREGTLSPEWLERLGFTTLELLPLRPYEVHELVCQWYEAVAATSGTTDDREHVLARCRALNGCLGMVSDLAEMLRIPQLAALACETLLDSDLRLPDDWILLIDRMAERLATRDAAAGGDLQLSSDEVAAIHRAVAFWSVHNTATLTGEHLEAALEPFAHLAAGKAAELAKHVLARHSILGESRHGISFVSEAFRDHLAAVDLAVNMYVPFLAKHAPSPDHARLVVATAGRLLPRRATQLVDDILDAADQEPGTSAVLAIVALCCAYAARNIDPATKDRASQAAYRFIPPADETVNEQLAAVAPQALDVLARTVAAEDERRAAILRLVFEIARAFGNRALSTVALFAGDPRSVEHELVWGAWTDFDETEYARLVLAHAAVTPTTVVVKRVAQVAALAALPRVQVIEARCEVDARLLRGRENLTIKVERGEMIVRPDLLAPTISVEVVGEGEREDGRP
ncbi:NACHT domain-containing protein [Micromonospora chersina]|uniref:NACHT domain-containing protein n=1 Tax=Micromonospora chersina TaxID=47854 RepID=UPI00371C66F8